MIGLRYVLLGGCVVVVVVVYVSVVSVRGCSEVRLGLGVRGMVVASVALGL